MALMGIFVAVALFKLRRLFAQNINYQGITILTLYQLHNTYFVHY